MNRREMFKMAATATLLTTGAVSAAEMKSTDRPMRRTDRILTLEEAKEVIRHTPHAVLATADASGQPYGVPISPALVGNDADSLREIISGIPLRMNLHIFR